MCEEAASLMSERMITEPETAVERSTVKRSTNFKRLNAPAVARQFVD